MGKKGKGKKKSPAVAADFKIHVDESCLSDSAEMPYGRTASSETMVPHGPASKIEESMVDVENATPEDEDCPEGQNDEIQDLIDELSRRESSNYAEEAEEHTKAVEETAEEGGLDSEVSNEHSPSGEIVSRHGDVEYHSDGAIQPVYDALLKGDAVDGEGVQMPGEHIESNAEGITDKHHESNNIEKDEIPADVKIEDGQEAGKEQKEKEVEAEAEAGETDVTLETDTPTEEHNAGSEEVEVQPEEEEAVQDKTEEHDDSKSINEADITTPTIRSEPVTAHLDESMSDCDDESLVDNNQADLDATQSVRSGHAYGQSQADIDEMMDNHGSEDSHQPNHSEHEQSELQYTDEGTDYDGSYLHDEDDAREDEKHKRMERAEALIQAAARAVVASIEQDDYHEDSVLSNQTDDIYDQSASELVYGEGTELTCGDQSELAHDDIEEGTYASETEHPSIHDEGDSSSHHDGDVEDDVFSHNSGQSKRSSMNSSDGLDSSEEAYQEKRLTTPQVGEEAAPEEALSRIPSATSYKELIQNNPSPSKVLHRPPFRTPSSVRAMQMSSPTQSLYGSPRSTKRHNQNFNPSASRLGTPSRRGSDFSHSHFSPSDPRTKTPSRVFKTKVDHPLVLLHVTVLPLQFQYAAAMNLRDEEIPVDLSGVKDSWRLLQEKLGEQVLIRGILLSHPQESYEVLEERLLETLELPVRPRARILKCGHYMGPDDYSSSAGDSSDAEEYDARRRDRGWCDICGRNVQFEHNEFDSVDRKFRVKVFASNGLMKAGAWAACWKEMERVDIEIEPYVEPYLLPDLERLQMEHATLHVHEEEFVPDSEVPDEAPHFAEEELLQQRQEDAEQNALRKKASEERFREIYGHIQEEAPPIIPEPRQGSRSQSRASIRDETLTELLLAAFKVAMRDRKNVMICVLSIVVLLLALRPRVPQVTLHSPHAHIPHQVHDIVQETMQEAIPRPMEVVADMPAKASIVSKEAQPLPKVKKTVKVNKPPAKPKAAVKKISEPPVQEEEIKEAEEYADYADYAEEAYIDEFPMDMDDVEMKTSLIQEEVYNLDPLEQTEPVLEPEPVDQEHYHIEPPTPKKVIRKPVVASQDIARSGKGVELASSQKRKGGKI